MLMVVILLVFGLALGSFINAFVWRYHEHKNWLNDRSECVHCHHKLAAKDLIPVVSWLSLRGRCRYCHKPISIQYPAVEALTASAFVFSYEFWPQKLVGTEVLIFALWLLLVIGLIALAVYDLRWMLLPSNIVYVLIVMALVLSGLTVARASQPINTLMNLVIGSIIGGGIFYLIFVISKGKWIGGGDVRLGFLLGLLAATPARSFLLIFIASLLGSAISLMALGFKGIKRSTLIPFGPFLILSLLVVQFAGNDILNWYTATFLINVHF